MNCVFHVVGRGRRDRGGADDESFDLPGRPSAPATLFDFLNTKIPAGKEGKATFCGQLQETYYVVKPYLPGTNCCRLVKYSPSCPKRTYSRLRRNLSLGILRHVFDKLWCHFFCRERVQI